MSVPPFPPTPLNWIVRRVVGAARSRQILKSARANESQHEPD